MAEGGALFAAIARHAEERPAEAAIRLASAPAGRAQWSWALLRDQAEAIAATLAGLDGRAPVGWLQQNHPHALTALLACARAGLPLAPLNWRLTEAELRDIEDGCGLGVVLTHRGAGEPHPYLGGLGMPGRPPCLDAEDLAGNSRGPAAGVADDAPLLVSCTSGTTGRPKGAVLTQAAVMANVAHGIALFGLTPADRVLTVLPLFHMGGLAIQTLPALAAGAQVILHARFDADAFFDSVARDRPTLTLLVPAVMRALVAHPRWRDADLSPLRAVGAGSSDVPLDLIEAFHAKGVPVQQVYGMTESGPIAIAQSVDEAWAAPGSIGRPVGLCEARIARPDGTEAATGEAGEIQLRGPNLFRGYWNVPEATRAAFTPDGWFRTGDVGHVDAAGRFWFTDRLKHLIISGGENIAPAEVERVLLTAPGVREGAVVGRPDPRWGEVPVAVIVPGDGFDPAAVLRHFDGRLARFKHPRAIVVAESLPRTALGKVRLEKLRELAG